MSVINDKQYTNKQYTNKIALIGDGGVGKTTFVKRMKTGEFERKYLPTIGVEVHELSFETNKGPFTFNVWDCAGQEKYGGLRDAYYIGAQVGIIMFDLTSKYSVQDAKSWVRDFARVCPGKPIILLGNKHDERDKLHPAKVSEFVSEALECRDPANKKMLSLGYYEVSANTNYNFEKPWLVAARFITGDLSLCFVGDHPHSE